MLRGELKPAGGPGSFPSVTHIQSLMFPAGLTRRQTGNVFSPKLGQWWKSRGGKCRPIPIALDTINARPVSLSLWLLGFYYCLGLFFPLPFFFGCLAGFLMTTCVRWSSLWRLLGLDLSTFHELPSSAGSGGCSVTDEKAWVIVEDSNLSSIYRPHWLFDSVFKQYFCLHTGEYCNCHLTF